MIAEAATSFWTAQEFAVPSNIVEFLLQPLRSYDKGVREAGAKAMASAVADDPKRTDAVMTVLMNSFEETLVPREVITDQLGNPIEDSHEDEWFFRSGIAQTWAAAAALWPAESVERLFTFLVSTALVKDRDTRSQEAVMVAGAALIDEIAKSSGSCDGVLQVSVVGVIE